MVGSTKAYFAVFLQAVGFIVLIWGACFGYTLGNITWSGGPYFLWSTYLQYDAMMANAFYLMIGSLFLCIGLLVQCDEIAEWGFVGGLAFFASFIVGVLRVALFPPHWGVPGSGFQLEMLVPFETLFVIATGLTLLGLFCLGLYQRATSRIGFSRLLSLFLMISVLFVVFMCIRGTLLISGAHGIIPYPVLGECSILLLLPYALGLTMTVLSLYEIRHYP